MGQENYGYLILIAIVFAASLETIKLIEIRMKRESYLQKYKPGTIQFATIQKSTNMSRLIFAITATVLSLCILILDVHVHAHYRDFLYILGFMLVIIAAGFALVPRVLRMSVTNRKDHRKS
jgi:cytochrome bd-type quinol oxidase subunit 2